MTEIFNRFPDFLKPRDLISVGLYSNRDALYKARIKGAGPDFIKLGHKILYAKMSVMQFIQDHVANGRFPQSKNTIKTT
jgi:hypothetical protein